MSDEKITAAGEEAARSHILGLVADYCDKYHNKKVPSKRGSEFLMRPASMTAVRW